MSEPVDQGAHTIKAVSYTHLDVYKRQDQISRLMNGDRFYYLYRLDQLQMGEGIINEQFKDIVERNTGAEHLNGSVFAYADKYYDLSETAIGSGVGPNAVLPNAKTCLLYTSGD